MVRNLYNIKDLLSVRGISYENLVSEKHYKLNWSLLDSVVNFTQDKLLELNIFGVLYDVDVDGLVSGKIIEEQLKKYGVIVSGEKLSTPCFICRQVITEFFDKDSEIVLVGKNDEEEHYLVKDMCPYPFDEMDL